MFVAGDAAHVMPPTGGFGGNAGIQDGYDLAWKLAYVLDGRADESLLETYDAERQPVGELTTEQAYSRYVLRLDPALGKDDLMPIVDEAAVELGYRYRSAADRQRVDRRRRDVGGPARALGAPGLSRAARARHGRRRRAVDAGSFRARLRRTRGIERGGLVLRCASGGRLARSSRERYRIGTDVNDATGQLEALYGTGPDGAVLVRPDGFVAWRSSAAHVDAAGELTAALDAALGRRSSPLSDGNFWPVCLGVVTCTSNLRRRRG